ncbi:MAG: hypothetical protein PF961_10190 [Planctomycetota bacterium]|jgi:hypothetical protein|nr:hypothetical protein [Planctomycetota bacterium]
MYALAFIAVAVAWVAFDAWRCHARIAAFLREHQLTEISNRWIATGATGVPGEVVMPVRMPVGSGLRLCSVTYAQREDGGRFRVVVAYRGWLWWRRLVFNQPELLDETSCDG